MNIDTEKEKICVNKIVEEKIENVTVEGDSIVPDVKPDVITAINTCGNICIYKKEIMDGRIRIDGCIDVYVVYLTESEEGIVRGLNTSIDFTHTIEMEKCTSNMNLELDTCLKSIDCKVINGRKINLKSNIEFKIRICENREEEVIKELLGVENIQKQNKVLQINSLIGRGNTKVIAKDTLSINDNETLGEILKSDCSITNKEYKMSYNKILVKSEIITKIIYLTEDNNINSISANIPVMGFIDIPNVSEDDICDINYLIKNIIVKPNNTEDQSITVEYEVEIDAAAYNTKDIEIIEDLYNPDYNIKFTTKNIETISNKSRCTKSMNLDENINLDGVQNNNIIDMEVIPIITNINTTNNKIMIEGEANLNIMFESNNSTGIDSRNVNLPFNTELEVEKSNNMRVNANVELRNNQTNMSNGNINIQMELEVNADLYSPMNMEIINELEVTEYEENTNSGMTIYFVKPNDSLWKIAKRFRTTVEDICSANNIEDCNKIEVGEQLFIPKYNRRKSA